MSIPITWETDGIGMIKLRARCLSGRDFLGIMVPTVHGGTTCPLPIFTPTGLI